MNKQLRQYCPEILIDDANQSGYLRELALFVKLKGICSHGWFRGKRAFARKHNIPKSAFSSQVNTLIKAGLITKKGDVYKLLTREQINKRFKTKHCSTVVFNQTDNLTQIQYLLLHKLKERSARQQQKVISEIQLIEKSKRGALAAVKRKFKGGGYESHQKQRLEKMKYTELLSNVGFTHDHIGKDLGVSKSTAYRFAEFAKSRNMCRTTTLRNKIACMSHNEFLQLREVFLERFTHVLWSNGVAYYNVCSLYKQVPYWDDNRDGISRRKHTAPSVVWTQV